MLGCADWVMHVQRASAAHPTALHPLLIWNTLPRAGASQYHGHAQVMLSEVRCSVCHAKPRCCMPADTPAVFHGSDPFQSAGCLLWSSRTCWPLSTSQTQRCRVLYIFCLPQRAIHFSTAVSPLTPLCSCWSRFPSQRLAPWRLLQLPTRLQGPHPTTSTCALRPTRLDC